MFHILTINPGSTSTKIAVFTLDTTQSPPILEKIIYQNLEHSQQQLKQHPELQNQIAFRTQFIHQFIDNYKLHKIDCIAARGGLVKPIAAGSFAINNKMLEDLTLQRYGKHASNLGALIANELRKIYHCHAFITDSVSTDELNKLARFSGLPKITRKSTSHALNIRAMARHAAQELGLKFDNTNFIVAHLGGGISIVALQNGHIIDTNNAMDGGPFTPQRAGTLPNRQLVELAFSGKYKSASDLIHKITHESGLFAHLGTNSGKEITAQIASGNKKAAEVFEAMAYQIAKEIGAMATVLQGDVRQIIITGGLARPPLIDWIIERVAWIAPISVYPGEREQEALAEAGARFLLGGEKLQEYL